MKTGLTLWKQISIAILLVGIAAAASGFGSCSGYSNLNPFYPVVVNPNPLAFACTPGPFTVSQAYYTGSFTAVSADNSKVTVAATSPPGTFVATNATLGVATSTTITVTGGGTQTVVNVSFQGCFICVRHHDMWGSARKRAR
jgi:hypothetical protein